MNIHNLYLPNHHSASDWDISSTDWTIATDQYISPPSSFKMPTLGEAPNIHLLCKHTSALQLPYGRLITYHRFKSSETTMRIDFRNTAPPGSVNFNNCYQVTAVTNAIQWTLREYLAGVQQRLWNRSKIPLSPDTWYRYRLSWWWDWDVLNLSFDIWLDGAWQQQGDIISIPNDLFVIETYQRVGIQSSAGNFYDYIWFDDTEIWEVV